MRSPAGGRPMIGSYELGSQRVLAGDGDELRIEPGHRQEPGIEEDVDVPLVRHDSRRRYRDDRAAVESEGHLHRRGITAQRLAGARRHDLQAGRRSRPDGRRSRVVEERNGGREP